MDMKVEKQSSKFIKPLVPKLDCHYKLGFIEEIASLVSVRIALFFPSNINHNNKFVAKLEKSLEKTLTRFYPLAGRYVKEMNIVDCNDQGVEFIHAQVNIKLADFIASKVNVLFIDEFIPSKFGVVDPPNDPLLATQVTTFECGGVAVGINAKHMLVDTSTLYTFINEWAVMNREENEYEFVVSGFNSSSLFPARGLHPLPLLSDDILSMYTRKKVSFSECSISTLKEKAKNRTHKWSKVQLVAAIIWKAFIDVDRDIYNSSKDSILIQPINLRGKMASSIPKSSCGNIFGLLSQEAEAAKSIEEFADLLSDCVRKSISIYSKVYHDNEEGETMVLNSFLKLFSVPDSTNLIMITSWCKFPFYEVDFGFGKPIWVAPGTIPIEKSAYLIDDAQGNGVEAFVFLKVEEVPKFEEALNRINALAA